MSKMITANQPVKLTLTVKRPNGQIEKVIHPTLKSITEAQFKQIQRDTAAAGRGDVLHYHIEYKTVSAYKNSFEAMLANTSQMGEVEKAMTLNGKTY